MVDFDKIKTAVEKRNEFLAQNPEMQIHQDEIDETLKKAGSQHNRNAMLAQMMRVKLYELQIALKDLLVTLGG